jgi:hypothetical protein
VVTLRGLYGNSGFVFATILTDLRQAEFNPLLTGSVRAVASAHSSLAQTRRANAEAPLRATGSKSQPPHLVYGYVYCLQNLSSDHLLSGVRADYRERAQASIGTKVGIEGSNKSSTAAAGW